VPPTNVCAECHGDKNCSKCNGTGINTHLNEDEPKCRNCSGTGVCPTCEGTGRAFAIGPEILDLKLNN